MSAEWWRRASLPFMFRLRNKIEALAASRDSSKESLMAAIIWKCSEAVRTMAMTTVAYLLRHLRGEEGSLPGLDRVGHDPHVEQTAGLSFLTPYLRDSFQEVLRLVALRVRRCRRWRRSRRLGGDRAEDIDEDLVRLRTGRVHADLHLDHKPRSEPHRPRRGGCVSCRERQVGGSGRCGVRTSSSCRGRRRSREEPRGGGGGGGAQGSSGGGEVPQLRGVVQRSDDVVQLLEGGHRREHEGHLHLFPSGGDLLATLCGPRRGMSPRVARSGQVEVDSAGGVFPEGDQRVREDLLAHEDDHGF